LVLFQQWKKGFLFGFLFFFSCVCHIYLGPVFSGFYCFPMMFSWSWNVMCWNVRGINSDKKMEFNHRQDSWKQKCNCLPTRD
jgi:hypothetical protein